VEALNTTTIRRLNRSRRHQLLAMALGACPHQPNRSEQDRGLGLP